MLTAAACLFAALRWIMTSKTSGVGVILEWMLLAWIPWMCFALVSLPIHPLASAGGLWILIGVITLTFVVIQFVPGGPVEQMMMELKGRGGAGEASGHRFLTE